MTVWVAFLRAVNVGGHGKLAMRDLLRVCGDAGFEGARTYIASGNAVFISDLDEAGVKAALETRLAAVMGAPIPVLVRQADSLKAAWTGCPFRDVPGNRVSVTFLDARPPQDALEHMSGQSDEVVHFGDREIYIHYPSGMGQSRLKLRAAASGTARNMNTVARLIEMTKEAGA